MNVKYTFSLLQQLPLLLWLWGVRVFLQGVHGVKGIVHQPFFQQLLEEVLQNFGILVDLCVFLQHQVKEEQ